MSTYWLHNNGTVREDSACPGEGVYCKPRRVVVLDPEDREQVERMASALRTGIEGVLRVSVNDYDLGRIADKVQAALRGLVEPPRPPEPAGLGAVVEAIHDNHFVHVGNGGWQRVEVGDRQGQICTYDEVAVIRVLSEGAASDV